MLSDLKMNLRFEIPKCLCNILLTENRNDLTGCMSKNNFEVDVFYKKKVELKNPKRFCKKNNLY